MSDKQYRAHLARASQDSPDSSDSEEDSGHELSDHEDDDAPLEESERTEKTPSGSSKNRLCPSASKSSLGKRGKPGTLSPIESGDGTSSSSRSSSPQKKVNDAPACKAGSIKSAMSQETVRAFVDNTSVESFSPFPKYNDDDDGSS